MGRSTCGDERENKTTRLVMKIAIIGASKGVGHEVVKRALARNHQVVTLSRSKIEFSEEEKGISIQGDARDKDTIQKVIADADAIIVTLGQGKDFSATTLTSDFAKHILALHHEQKIMNPLLFLSGFGAGDSLPYNKWFVKIIFKTLLKKVYADKKEMEEMISASNLNWEIVRPGKLTDEPLTEDYRVESTLFKGINITKISRADVADFMVKQAEDFTFPQQFISLTKD